MPAVPPRPLAAARLRPVLLPLLLLGALVPWSGCGEDRPADPPGHRGAGPYDQEGRATRPLPTPKAPPNLVVLVLDTLRGDAVAPPGTAGGAMPFVTSLAEQGTMFLDATAPAPWTLPSIATLLTGLPPSEHGCNLPDRSVLPRAITTFAEVLRNAYGFETAALVAGPWMDVQGPLLQGFAHVETRFALRGGEAMIDAWDATRDRTRPFCLLLHTMEAHDPYGEANHAPAGQEMRVEPLAQPPDPARMEDWQIARSFLLSWSERAHLGRILGARLFDIVVRYLDEGFRRAPRPELAAELEAAYLAGVRWVDGLVARTVQHLRSRGLLENTMLVVTGDHGEAFGEHGILEHGRDLHDELLRIPLVVVGPPPFRGSRLVSGGVGLVDVFPTYFDLAGLEPIPGTSGLSALPLVLGRRGGRVVFSETERTPANTRQLVDTVLVSARSDRWKYIVAYDRQGGTVLETAYDLATDPRELEDLTLGTGRIDGLPFDGEFCAAVERIRSQLRTAIDARHRQQAGGYSGGNPTLDWNPAPCGRSP